MDIDHVTSMRRALSEQPTRRAVARGLVGVLVASGFATLPRLAEIEAGNKKRGRKRKKRQRDKKKPKCPQLPTFELCKAGDFSECCDISIDPQTGNPRENCTECGCCDYKFSECCLGRDEAVCCAEGEKCCYGPNFEVRGCCTKEQKCCPNEGCAPRNFCCSTVRSSSPAACCPPGEEPTALDGCCNTQTATICAGQRCCAAETTCTSGTHNGVVRAACCATTPPPGTTIIPCDGICCQTTTGIVCCPGLSNPCRDPALGC